MLFVAVFWWSEQHRHWHTVHSFCRLYLSEVSFFNKAKIQSAHKCHSDCILEKLFSLVQTSSVHCSSNGKALWTLEKRKYVSKHAVTHVVQLLFTVFSELLAAALSWFVPPHLYVSICRVSRSNDRNDWLSRQSDSPRSVQPLQGIQSAQRRSHLLLTN